MCVAITIINYNNYNMLLNARSNIAVIYRYINIDNVCISLIVQFSRTWLKLQLKLMNL